MNPVHAHLLSTHLPVLGTLFGLLLLVIAWWQRNPDLSRTSLQVFAVSGLAALPTYLTGRPASTLLLKLVPGTSLDASDQHAEVAAIALTLVLVLAGFALGGLLAFRQNRIAPRWFLPLTLALALLSTAALVWTAHLGGKIRHTEIVPGTSMWSRPRERLAC